MNFTAKDIVAIIKAVEATSISSFEFKSLKIEIGERKPRITIEAKAPSFEKDLYRQAETLELEDKPFDIDKQIQDEIDNDPMLQDMQRMNLMIEDPHAFEALMDREDIEDATNSERAEQSVSEG